MPSGPEEESRGKFALATTSNRAGALPFMAIDVLQAKPWPHLLLYDLESLVYSLIWVLVQHNPKAKRIPGTVHESLAGWVTCPTENCSVYKDNFVTRKTGPIRSEIRQAVGKDFEPIWDSVISPLLQIFAKSYNEEDQYDYATRGGHITFHKVMKGLEEICEPFLKDAKGDCDSDKSRCYPDSPSKYGLIESNCLTILRVPIKQKYGHLGGRFSPSTSKELPRDSLTVSHRRIGTLSFTAIDYLNRRPWGYLSRYDLESFVYALVWAAGHHRKNGLRDNESMVHPAAFDGWITGTVEERARMKDLFVTSAGSLVREEIDAAVTKDCTPVREDIIDPLLELFAKAYGTKAKPQRAKVPPTEYDYDSCGGVLTFQTFMEAIGETPCRDMIGTDMSWIS